MTTFPNGLTVSCLILGCFHPIVDELREVMRCACHRWAAHVWSLPPPTAVLLSSTTQGYVRFQNKNFWGRVIASFLFLGCPHFLVLHGSCPVTTAEDWRIFCGDLGGDVTDEMLTKAFQKYPSLVRARVIRIKSTGKSRGYGFVSFTDPHDMARAIREMDGKYVGQRPVKLRKAKSDARTISRKEAKRLVDQGEVQIAANCRHLIRF